jgi:hypothetical protein
MALQCSPLLTKKIKQVQEGLSVALKHCPDLLTVHNASLHIYCIKSCYWLKTEGTYLASQNI